MHYTRPFEQDRAIVHHWYPFDVYTIERWWSVSELQFCNMLQAIRQVYHLVHKRQVSQRTRTCFCAMWSVLLTLL